MLILNKCYNLGFFDFIPSQTSIEEVKKKGFEVDRKTSNNYSVCNYNDFALWDFDGDDIFECMYMTHWYNDGKLPQNWEENLGLKWSNSYKTWRKQLKALGFKIKILKYPVMEYYENRKTLSAEFEAISPTGDVVLDLEFGYGNDKQEGYDAKAKNSLYRISINTKTTENICKEEDEKRCVFKR